MDGAAALRDFHPAMAALFLLGQPLVASYGLPGRADHHLLILLLAALVFGAALRIIEDRDSFYAARIAGLAAGMGIWVSTEGLFAYGLATVIVGLPWLFARPGEWAGINRRLHEWTLLAVALGLALERPPSGWTAVELDRISIVHVALAAGLAAFWALSEHVPARTLRGRVGWSMAAAAVLAVGLSALDPAFLLGPFGEADPRLQHVWLSHVQEFRPLPWSPGRAVAYFGAPLLALGGVAGRLRTHARVRRATATLALPLLVCTVIRIWQVRWLMYAELLAAGLMAVLVSRLRSRLDDRFSHRLVAAAAVVVAASGWVVAGTLIDAAVVHRPTAAGRPLACDEATVIRGLEGAAFRRPRTIAAHVNLGPAIVFRTPHAVLAAPYHRNSGTLVVRDAMNATDPDQSRRLLAARGADLVLVCRDHDDSLFRREVRGQPTLYGRLLSGQPPPWLRRLGDKASPTALFYRDAPVMRWRWRAVAGWTAAVIVMVVWVGLAASSTWREVARGWLPGTDA